MALRSIAIRIGYALGLAGLLVLAVRSGEWSLTAGAILRAGPGAVALALAVSALSLTMNGIVWARVLRRLGHPASVCLGLTIYAGTGLASYIGMGPGALGQCMLLLRRRGVYARGATLLLTIGSLIGFCGCLVWTPFAVAMLNGPAAVHALPALGSRAPLIALIAIVVCALGTVACLWLVTLAPRLGSRWILARIITDPSRPPMRLYLRHMLTLIPLSALAWLVSAGPLWIFVQTSAPRLEVSLTSLIAVQSAAAVVGGMAFFLPNGLGARDGITVALLAGVMGVPIPAAGAAVLLARASDPLAKALILVVLAILGRIPTLTHWHSKIHNHLRPSRVAALVCTLLRPAGY